MRFRAPGYRPFMFTRLGIPQTHRPVLLPLASTLPLNTTLPTIAPLGSPVSTSHKRTVPDPLASVLPSGLSQTPHYRHHPD